MKQLTSEDKTMNTEYINTEFQDNTLRCEKVYPLFAFTDASLEGHELIEKILDYDKSLNKALGFTDEFFDKIEGLHKCDKSDEIESFLYNEGKWKGYLGKFARPIITKFYEDGYSFSWCWHHTTWLYAKTLDDLFKKSFEWAKERHEQDLKDWKEG